MCCLGEVLDESARVAFLNWMTLNLSIWISDCWFHGACLHWTFVECKQPRLRIYDELSKLLSACHSLATELTWHRNSRAKVGIPRFAATFWVAHLRIAGLGTIEPAETLPHLASSYLILPQQDILDMFFDLSPGPRMVSAWCAWWLPRGCNICQPSLGATVLGLQDHLLSVLPFAPLGDTFMVVHGLVAETDIAKAPMIHLVLDFWNGLTQFVRRIM